MVIGGTLGVVVMRAGPGDATLASRMLRGVTLMPGFASGTTAHTASVSSSVTQTTISAMATHSNANVVFTPEDVDAVTDEPQVNPGMGATTIGMTAIAGDRETSRTFTDYGDEEERIATPQARQCPELVHTPSLHPGFVAKMARSARTLPPTSLPSTESCPASGR